MIHMSALSLKLGADATRHEHSERRTICPSCTSRDCLAQVAMACTQADELRRLPKVTTPGESKLWNSYNNGRGNIGNGTLPRQA